mgnify:CR=1 FL=1
MKSNNKFNNIRIHFIGIGGIGMSGIAELMFDLGYKIQGSDININSNISRLKKRGIIFYKGHNKANIKEINAAVFSSAIKKNNPELLECKRLKIPIVSRADMLGELMKFKKSIAIAGSHGKTTTTSLVGSMLDRGKFDPTIINGGIINSYSKNNRFGLSEWMVVEADESDGSFLRLPHQINIITNLDSEHLDFYKSKENLNNAFLNFINNIPFYGYSILCIESENLKKLSKKIKTRNIITYSINQKDSDVIIKTIKKNKKNTEFTLVFNKKIIKDFNKKIIFKSTLLGEHNILNATGAIIASLLVKVSISSIKKALVNFQGVKRRFTFLGKLGKAYIYDDYAHHPSEIRASFEIAKQISEKKIIVVFQPHRYSRTNYLYDDFIKILKKIKYLFILDIYPAGEKPIKKINSYNIVKQLNKTNKNVFYLKDIKLIRNKLNPYLNENNSIIFMGAGSITYLANSLFDKKNDK